MVAVLVACMMAVPTVCHSHEFILRETMPLNQFLEAQQRAAEWLARHPGMVSHGVTIQRGRSA